MRHSGCGRTRERNLREIPQAPGGLGINSAAAPLRIQWAHGYSGCRGVASSGLPRGVDLRGGLPSTSPLRIAVTAARIVVILGIEHRDIGVGQATAKDAINRALSTTSCGAPR